MCIVNFMSYHFFAAENNESTTEHDEEKDDGGKYKCVCSLYVPCLHLY